MNCEICQIIGNRLGQIYEDDVLYAYLDPTPVSKGHIIVTTKEHFTIIEQIPNDILKHLMVITNKLLMLSFEITDINGTNIIINNGISAGQKQNHVTVNIIPRNEDDDLDFSWTPKKLSQEELGAIELKLQVEEEKKEEKKVYGDSENNDDESEEIDSESPKEQNLKEEDYLLKQLRRIP